MKKGDVIETMVDGSVCSCSFLIWTKAVIMEVPYIDTHGDHFINIKWLRKNPDGTTVMNRYNRPLSQMNGGYYAKHFTICSPLLTPRKLIRDFKFI